MRTAAGRVWTAGGALQTESLLSCYRLQPMAGGRIGTPIRHTPSRAGTFRSRSLVAMLSRCLCLGKNAAGLAMLGLRDQCSVGALHWTVLHSSENNLARFRERRAKRDRLSRFTVTVSAACVSFDGRPWMVVVAPWTEIPGGILGEAVYTRAPYRDSCWATVRKTDRISVTASLAKLASQVQFHPLKVVCHLALTIWSYWHGCREQIFLNISNASNSMETRHVRGSQSRIYDPRRSLD